MDPTTSRPWGGGQLFLPWGELLTASEQSTRRVNYWRGSQNCYIDSLCAIDLALLIAYEQLTRVVDHVRALKLTLSTTYVHWT